ncbi:hypothetical protein FRC10_006924, partial [Ceratobasidium sp. 414]
MANYCDEEATYGAPPATIAMACTVTSSGSKNKGKSKQADYATVLFKERMYAQHYHAYLKELKGYHQLDLVRRFHMKALLQEYADQFPSG